MKTSLPIEQQEPNATPSTRREVMKQGLGLSLGSSALGLAGLGASSSAQAWGPWHVTDIHNLQFLSYIREHYPKYMASIAVNWPLTPFIRIQWRNSNDAMTKQGYIFLCSSQHNKKPDLFSIICFFQFNQYENDYHDKDLVGTVYLKMPSNSRELSHPSSSYSWKLSRRKLPGVGDNPFEGQMARIYEAWQARAYGSNYASVQIDPTHRIWIRALTDTNIINTAILRTGYVSFIATNQQLTANNFWEDTSRDIDFSVDYMMAGGAGATDWETLSYVSLPNINETIAGVSNWSSNLLQVAGIGGYRTAVINVSNAYTLFRAHTAPASSVRARQAGWYGAAASAGLALSVAMDGEVNTADGAVICGALGVAALSFYFGYSAAQAELNIRTGLFNDEIIVAMHSFIRAVSTNWPAHARGTQNLVISTLLENFPKLTLNPTPTPTPNP